MILFIAILANALLQTGCGSTIRYISARSDNPCRAATLNFFVSALLAGGYFLYRGDQPEDWEPVLAVSAFTGVFYALSFLAVLWTMKTRGMAIVLAFVNLALFVPILIGIGFGDRPSMFQYVGLAVTAAAVPLLSMATVTGTGITARPSWKLIAGLFVLQGCAMGGNLIADRVLPQVSVAAYVSVLFLIAGCICLCACRWLPGHGSKRIIGPGVVQGILGCSSTIGIMLALNAVSATIFFCGISIVGLLFNIVVATIVWRERLALRAWVGLALAGLAMVLLNL